MNKLIFSLLTLACSFGAGAQSFAGSWDLIPNYSTPNKVIETPEFVYTLSGASITNSVPVGGSLSFYDKTTDEVGAMNSTNRLNANKVYNIWYDKKEKCLLVLFDDYNIDIVYEDGRTINVPDLRDAAISESKIVNDVAFSNGKAYVALKSGIIVIDMEHGAITESALWGKDINCIAALEKKLLLRSSTDKSLYIADLAGSHHNFENSFNKVNLDLGAYNLMYIGNGKVYATDIVRGYILTINEDETNSVTSIRFTDHPGVTTSASLVPTRNGAMSFNGSTVNYIDADGNYTKVEISAANGNKVADWQGDGKNPWIADGTGFGKYDTENSRYTISPVKPNGTSGSNVGRIIQHPVTGNFYISTVELNQHYTLGNLALNKQSYADIYDPSTGKFTIIPSSLLRTSLTGFDIDPNNPEIVFVGQYLNMGDIVNINSKTKSALTVDNTGISSKASPKGWAVDDSGNLFVAFRTSTSTMELLKILKGSWENGINSSGCSTLSVPVNNANFASRIVLDKTNNIIIATDQTGIAAVQLPDSDKPLSSSCKSVYVKIDYDSDGSTISGWKYPALAVEKGGRVWIGNDQGVMYINDTREIFNSGFAVTRPKVARNDGTNLADYLLNQVEVICIAVDANNNKWIGTMGSGLYMVSEDGSEIIEHITTENSDIPSDEIFAVCPDSNSNDVYIGTADGLSIYHSTTAPAADDYNDIYAYPNPVTPDYTGYITITGLKANSLVKITDASGNVFYETTSNGGMALWNGCDASGRRVRSGIYFVFASESDENGSDAAVTKIVVVN